MNQWTASLCPPGANFQVSESMNIIKKYIEEDVRSLFFEEQNMDKGRGVCDSFSLLQLY